jgi:hypothetical protein
MCAADNIDVQVSYSVQLQCISRGYAIVIAMLSNTSLTLPMPHLISFYTMSYHQLRLMSIICHAHHLNLPANQTMRRKYCATKLSV